MAYDTWFDSDENKTLMAVCTRRLIRNIGIGGIVWGFINTVIGILALQVTLLNVGLLILGVLMLGLGIQAIKTPSHGVLLMATLVAVLLFLWNLCVSVLNSLVTGRADPWSLIFPLIIAVVFANYYRKLGHLREQIASVQPEAIRTAKQMCKTLIKKKLKDEPRVIQTTNRKCRAQLLENRAFFIQRDLMRAFIGSREDIRGALVRPDAGRLKARFQHPLGLLKYQFDKKNSEKLKNWLADGGLPVVPPSVERDWRKGGEAPVAHTPHGSEENPS